MAAANLQTIDPDPSEGRIRSPEELALRKAEKKKRKSERKLKRKARKAAADLAEQAPRPAREDAPAPSPAPAPAPGVRTPVRPVPISNEGLKSARSHYSSIPTKVSTQQSADDESEGVEEILDRRITTRSPDPLTKESLQSGRAQYSSLRIVTNQSPILSSLSMSSPEYDSNVIMTDCPEPESLDPNNRIISTAISDSDEDGSIEETIITQGAQATLSRSSRTLVPKPHLQALDLSVDPGDSDDEELSTLGDSDLRGREPEQIKPKRHAGFPPSEDLPGWFPSHIKEIYRVDRHGGALSFKELNEITQYRTALEIIRRQKWTTYIEAGEARWKLQKILRRLRIRPLTKAFYQYRNKQYKVWKEKALKSWKRLEKTHLGVCILDETININFRQERIIYEKKLGGRL
ncbi:hypothetical protein BKA65DRAFT_596682 [Rhexocercosporidium sp. MPI-PUGE-AT-0058]|nr:hypothetical protein BKA65DRAFT_596682 [Rhexocercosporidium sp. MPI-PUGE-AT-0058]